MQKPHAFITPPDIVMTEFEKHKKAGDWWYSSTPTLEGTRCACLWLQVAMVVVKAHVSVFCYLNRGEYDDQLKWPFRGDITIQLLNQSSDEGHWEWTDQFDDRVADEYAGRVVGKERATGGWGKPLFIAHNKLNTENKEYLKNDCLKFRILKIGVKSI